jgi:hypothetical protein
VPQARCPIVRVAAPRVTWLSSRRPAYTRRSSAQSPGRNWRRMRATSSARPSPYQRQAGLCSPAWRPEGGTPSMGS